MAKSSWLNHKLLVVTGKGGVGKTTLSLSLGLLAANSGRKTLVAEIQSEEQISRMLEIPPVGYEPREIFPNLWTINIDAKKAFQEYVLTQIKFERLYKLVFQNELVSNFIDATPGLSDLMSIGKVYDLSHHYDLVIVDAPASGHSVALLKVPTIVSSAVRVGPLKTESEKISELLHDPKQTQVVVVTLPEEMPVAESIDLVKSLEEGNFHVAGMILNQYHQFDWSPAEKTEWEEFAKKTSPQNGDVMVMQRKMDKVKKSLEYKSKLCSELEDMSLVTVPFQTSFRFGLSEIQKMAQALQGALE